jgi:hypothetical protein
MWTASSQLLVRRVCSRAATRTPRLRWTSTSRRTCAAVPCRIVVCAAACCPGVRVHALHFSLLACCVVGGMLSPTLPCLISPRPASPCVAPSRLPSALSCPVLSYPIPSYPILSYPILSYPILSCPVPRPALSYPILRVLLPALPFCFCSISSRSSLPCPALPCPALPYPVLSCPVLSYPASALACPTWPFSPFSVPSSSSPCPVLGFTPPAFRAPRCV